MAENGGHLVSVSEDGTISVTNMASGEIQKALLNYSASSGGKGIEKHDFHRAEECMKEREQGRRVFAAR